MKIAFILAVLIGVGNAKIPWSWDKVSLWADTGTTNTSLFTDYQSKFLADNYKFITIKKCLGDPSKSGRSTEDAFYQVASQIREYSPWNNYNSSDDNTYDNNTRILFYFSISEMYCNCYNITKDFCSNESMWLKNSSGYPILGGNSNRDHPYFDMTQKYVQNYYVNTVSTVIKMALSNGIIINGIFVDGACTINNFQNDGINESVNIAYQNGIDSAMSQLKNNVFKSIMNEYKLLNNITIDIGVYANGLSSYSKHPNKCTNLISHSDGVFICHFGAFEEIDTKNNKNGDDQVSVNATDIIEWTNIVNEIIIQHKYGNDKKVFIKGWVGPEDTPTDSLGPTWPSTYKYYPRPNNHSGIAYYASKLIDYPLAMFLCGLAYERVYFAYTFWWDINDGWVSCPDNQNQCSCPNDWYQEFMNKLGKPTSNPDINYNTFDCKRTFEHANVFVNFANDTSALIEWL